MEHRSAEDFWELMESDGMPEVARAVVRAAGAMAMFEWRNSRGQFNRWGVDVAGLPVASVGDVRNALKGQGVAMGRDAIIRRLRKLSLVAFLDDDGKVDEDNLLLALLETPAGTTVYMPFRPLADLVMAREEVFGA